MKDFIYNLWNILLELSPWLLFGCLIAGLLHIFMPAGFVRKHLGKSGLGAIIKAVAIGVPMPLCSCGVIPAAIGLKKDGASDGAAVGFLISTPQTGVDSIMVSAAFLGWPFAIFKVLSAFVSGLIGGLIINLFDTSDHTPEVKTTKCCCSAEKEKESEPSCCSGESKAPSKESGKKENWFIEMISFTIMLLRGIYTWLVIGVILAAIISTLLPEGKLADYKITAGITGMLLMLLISLPMYICATSSVPLAASLVAAGMPAGSALVLLMAGPATNIATIGAITGAFGKKVTAIYVATVAVMSVILGYLFQSVIQTNTQNMHHGHTLPHQINLIAAIILICLLTWFALGDIKKKLNKSTHTH